MHVGLALMAELGATRRATKTVMHWTGVSDRTAQAWLHGKASPSARHLLTLGAHSPAVMRVVLRLSGHDDLEIGIGLKEIEAALMGALELLRTIGGLPRPTE